MEKREYFDLKQRADYAHGIEKMIGRYASKAAAARRNRALNGDKEKLRKEFVDMLGWPLNMKNRESFGEITVRTEELPDFNGMKCTRYQLKILAELWFYGILYEPLKNGEKSFVIAQHGGWGSPEIVGGQISNSANYNHMVERIVKRGATAFAPQLLLWDEKIYGTHYDQMLIDRMLKQLGGSRAALEIFCIMRSVDYFISVGLVSQEHIGMVGLSYGGMYALLTAAADIRIKSALVSCFFNDRMKYNREDMAFFGQADLFMDAEVASLILPRKLYIENGERDDCFLAGDSRVEIERLREYATMQRCSESLRIKIFDGVHELDKDDAGLEFVIDAIRRNH